MTLRQDIDSFKARIAEAEIKREAWRAAGNREKYLEAYFAVEAMELLLEDRMLDERASGASRVVARENSAR